MQSSDVAFTFQIKEWRKIASICSHRAPRRLHVSIISFAYSLSINITKYDINCGGFYQLLDIFPSLSNLLMLAL